MGLAQVAEQRQHLFPLLSSWFSLPSCGMLLRWEMQLGRGLEHAVSAVSCPGVFQLQRGCWVDLCVFEGVFESVSPRPGTPFREGGSRHLRGQIFGGVNPGMQRSQSISTRGNWRHVDRYLPSLSSCQRS